MNDELQPGYYWVKHETGDKWKVAEYTGADLWYFTGNELGWETEDFTEIGPRIDPPAN